MTTPGAPSSFSWPEVTAVFGGTFDPPHLGHRAAVKGLFMQPGVGRVLVLPSGIPALKQARTPTEHRWRMTELTFGKGAGFPGPVELSRIEIQRFATKPTEPSYTFDTLMELRRTFPKVAFVIGADQVQELEKWHRFPDLLGLCHWLCLRRKGADETACLSALSRWQAGGLIRPDPLVTGQWEIRSAPGTTPMRLKFVPTDAPELSSSEIRESIQKTGQAPKNSLAPEVLRYLNENGLYGTRLQARIQEDR